MKKRVLFLDDMIERHEAFLRNHPHFEVRQAFTAEEAIAILKNEAPFDAAFLDHDLKQEHYDVFFKRRATYGTGTGMEVVDFITGMVKKEAPATVIVHSMNSAIDAAPEMEKRLLDAGFHAAWQPFEPGRIYLG